MDDIHIMPKHWIVKNSDGSLIINNYPERPEPNLDNPHVYFLYSEQHLDSFTDEKVAQLKEFHVGAICLFSGYYTNGSVPQGLGAMGGKFYDFLPELEQKIMDVVAKTSDHNLKVLAYSRPYGHEAFSSQDYRVSLLNALEFGYRHSLDGWYFDGYDFGSYQQTIQVLSFLKKLDAVLFIHSSIGVGGNWQTNPWGERPIFVTRFADYSMRNEVTSAYQPKADDSPLWELMNDTGYGNSISCVKCDADRIQIPEKEFYENCARLGLCLPLKDSKWKEWADWYWEVYLEKRKEAGDE